MAQVTGSHQTPGKTNAHWEQGWNLAVQDALNQMTNYPGGFPAGEATVELCATINPGSIVEYSVKITST